MFTLIAMGTGVAWLYSTVALFLPNLFPADTSRATVRQLVGVTHADQVGGNAAAQRLQVRQHIAQ